MEIDSLTDKIDRVIMVIRIINLVMTVKINIDNHKVAKIGTIFIVKDLVSYENG